MTHPTNFRALCAELVNKIEYTWGDVPPDVGYLMGVTRAALAAPQSHSGGLPHYPDSADLKTRLEICIEHEYYHGGGYHAAVDAIMRDIELGYIKLQAAEPQQEAQP